MTNDTPEIVELGSRHSKVASPGSRAPLLPPRLQSPFSAASRMPAPFCLWCPQKLTVTSRELQVPQGGEKGADLYLRVRPSFLLAHRLAPLTYSLGIPS